MNLWGEYDKTNFQKKKGSFVFDLECRSILQKNPFVSEFFFPTLNTFFKRFFKKLIDFFKNINFVSNFGSISTQV